MPFNSASPLISIIITTYNRASVIGKAIKSVLHQTYQNFELIIIDDGSQDNTEKIVKKWQKTNKKIRYYLLPNNLGANIARNIGIQLANGEYLAFLDSDDEWYPHKLEKQLSKFQESKSSKLGLVYCGLVKFYPRGIISFKIEKKSGNIFQDLLVSNFIGGASVPLIKKDVFDDCGGFSELGVFQKGGSQDYEMWLRIASKFSIEVVTEILVKYTISKNSVSLSSELSNPINRVKARLVIVNEFLAYFNQHPKAITALFIAIGPGMIRMNKLKEIKRLLKSALNFTPFSKNLYFHLLIIDIFKDPMILLFLWDFPIKLQNFLTNIPFYFNFLIHNRKANKKQKKMKNHAK